MMRGHRGIASPAVDDAENTSNALMPLTCRRPCAAVGVKPRFMTAHVQLPCREVQRDGSLWPWLPSSGARTVRQHCHHSLFETHASGTQCSLPGLISRAPTRGGTPGALILRFVMLPCMMSSMY